MSKDELRVVVMEAVYPHVKHSCNTHRWVEAMVEDVVVALVGVMPQESREMPPVEAYQVDEEERETLEFARSLTKEFIRSLTKEAL